MCEKYVDSALALEPLWGISMSAIRGNASRADAQRLLMDATGTATIGDAVAAYVEARKVS